jgi:hypothetical protein
MGSACALAVDEIISSGAIKAGDVQRLRGLFFDDATIGFEEADKLFLLNEACPVQDSSWSPFFIEVVADYVVNQAQPEGYVTAENAAWLIARISHQGRVRTRNELDLLLAVIDRARWCPVSLVTFAMEQVHAAVLTGRGPLRPGEAHAAGRIEPIEVELVRRLLYAFGGDGSLAITRAEAEILFDIEDAIGDRPSPAWTDLFVKAVANAVMASSGYAVPSREEALRKAVAASRPLDQPNPFAFLYEMVTTSLDGVIQAYRAVAPEERAIARLERQRLEIITNDEITEVEASWLADRLGRDGQLTANERALLAYLCVDGRPLAPALQAVVARIGKAA